MSDFHVNSEGDEREREREIKAVDYHYRMLCRFYFLMPSVQEHHSLWYVSLSHASLSVGLYNAECTAPENTLLLEGEVASLCRNGWPRTVKHMITSV